jgi:tetratricopeptide (TPR) repeat protein
VNSRPLPAIPEVKEPAHRVRDALPAIAIAACFVLLLVYSFRQISGADYWWQYATGRLIVSEGIPRVDSFSYTRTGEPWIELRWLFCATLYGITRTVGHIGAQCMQALVMGGAFYIAWLTANRSVKATALAALLLGIVASSQRMFVRPEMVSFLLSAVFLLVVVRFRQSGTRWIWVLPLLQILWTNAHTQFPLGVGICAAGLAATIFEQFVLKRRTVGSIVILALVTCACAAACFVNPYGWRGAVFPIQLFRQIHGTVFKQHIGEFASPFALDVSPVFIAFVSLLILTAWTLWRSLGKLDAAVVVWTLATGYLACVAIRNVPLFALSAVVLSGARVVPRDRTVRSTTSDPAIPAAPPANPVVGSIVAVIASGMAILCATNLLSRWFDDGTRYGLGLLPHRYPLGAAAFLANAKPSGRVINTMTEGSFLTAIGVKVFIDPRLEVYGEEFYDGYLKLQNNQAAWNEAQSRWKFEVAVVDPGSPMVDRIVEAGNFTLMHFEAAGAVFVEKRVPSPPLDAAAAERLVSKLPNDIQWRDRRKLAQFLMATGYPRASAALLERIPASERSNDAKSLLAMGLMRSGRFDAAVKVLRELDQAGAGDAQVKSMLGAALIESGSIEEGLRLVEQALALDNRNAATWAFRARALAAQGKNEAAVEAMSKAVELEPGNSFYVQALESLRRPSPR